MKKDGKFKNLGKTLLNKGLPLLANVVSGGTAGKVIELVKGVANITSDDPDELERAVTQNPELVSKLKQLEMDHKVELEKLVLEGAKLELEETKAYIGDVQSARNRELELAKATGKRDWLLMALAITVVVGFFALIFFAIIDADGLKNNGPINQLFGALVAGFSMVLSYFFGSSKGSADKNTIMERQSNKQAMQQAAPESFNNAKG